MPILNQYTNPNDAGSFSGLSGFVKNNKNINKQDAKDILLKEQSNCRWYRSFMAS